MAHLKPDYVDDLGEAPKRKPRQPTGHLNFNTVLLTITLGVLGFGGKALIEKVDSLNSKVLAMDGVLNDVKDLRNDVKGLDRRVTTLEATIHPTIRP